VFVECRRRLPEISSNPPDDTSGATPSGMLAFRAERQLSSLAA
jgi:hypothetical protein